MRANRLALCITLAASLAACSDPATKVGADWACAPVEGVGQLVGSNAPRFVLVGEFTETNEGPATFAEVACNMARTGKTLFVGVSEYLGGASDAETRMRLRLDDLAARGAPIVIGVVGEQGREYNPRARNLAETHWAESIETKVAAAGAAQALILIARSDAALAPVRATVRSASYDPMPMHLDGSVLSLEIAQAPGVPGPAIRLYPQPRAGFHGQLAVASLTRPAIAVALPAKNEAATRVLPSPWTTPAEDAEFFMQMKTIIETAKAGLAEQGGSTLPIPAPDVQLPEFELEDTPQAPN